MSDNFVPLASFLRPVAQKPVVEPPPPAEGPTADPCDDYNETLRAARRFRAGLSDALETAVEQMLPKIAKEVLARELQLADADVAAILSAALDRFAGDTVLCVRAHPRDWAALAGFELERVADASLQPGDVRLDLRSGTIDLTLAARLDAALAACSA
ncbi:MAG TPA: FliH/SctL family protein [Candidatus Cybelea sp.]